MGVSIETWRVRIGMFGGPKLGGTKDPNEETVGSYKCMFFLIYLLIIGNVELNPGPTIDDVFQLLQESKQQMENNFKDLNQKIDNVELNLKQKVNDNLERIEKLETENTKLRQEISELFGKHQDLENRSRRDNLIFYGVKEAEDDTESWNDCKSKVLDVINRVLEVEEITSEHIARAHRLGHHKGNRPIIVKFVHYGIKEKVLMARAKLKGSDIFLNEDFSQKVREERSFLLAAMRQARSQNLHATVTYNKLKVEGVLYRYSWEEKKVVKIGRSGNDGNYEDIRREQETPAAEARVTRQHAKKMTALSGRIDSWLQPRGGNGSGGGGGGGRGRGGGGGGDGGHRNNDYRGGGGKGK